jgi:hypothetical protein
MRILLFLFACNSSSLPANGDLGADLSVSPDVPCPLRCGSGCCDTAGTCQAGSDDNACGTGGNPCDPCVGSSCIAVKNGGQCVAPDGGVCNSDTCANGCCQGGQCIIFITEQACGSGGEACKVCPPGDFCKGGCFHMMDNCGPSNCPGCCIGTWCATGNQNNSCGKDGLECFDCRPGPDCVPSGGGGLCGGKPPCLNCNGCCLDGQCVQGSSDTQCGGQGRVCDNCAVQGWDCVLVGPNSDYRCGRNNFCDKQSCAGCCFGSVCGVGTQDVACGTGGVNCVDCLDQKKTCVNGACY